jgi:chemotaxis protein methyltransferase CheR
MNDPIPELTPQQFERFRGFIEARTGIYYPDSRRDALSRALIARLSESEAADWDEYRRLLLSCAGRAEFRRLLRCVTIGETAFFRVPSQFEALREALVPAIIGKHKGGAIGIWSAGCATGEEAYSIAITLAEMSRALRGWHAQVLGTDVSAEAIANARQGCYSERALSAVTRERLARHFRRRPDGYEVKPELRRRVAFDEFNLAGCGYPRVDDRPWDIIFCRNVTMYFRPQTTRRVVAKFGQVLCPGGFLVLGPTESLAGICDDFAVIETQGAFIYVKPPMSPALASLRRVCRADRAGHRAGAETEPGLFMLPSSCGQSATASGMNDPAGSRDGALRAAANAASEDEACAAALAAIAADDWLSAEQALTPFAAGSCSRRPRLLLAWLRAAQGKCDEAAALCHDLLAWDPLLAPAHYILGVMACRTSDPEEGVEHLSKAIYSDDHLVPAHYHLGIAQSARGDRAAARRAFRGCLRALGDGRDGWHDFAEGLAPEHWRRACEERLAAIAAQER